MTEPTHLLLYVESPTASAPLYAALLGRAPVEASPSFVMFVLASGLKLGLWARHDVKPGAGAPAGGAELCFAVESDDAVRAALADWKARGLRIAQEPVRLDFGYTFTALDPDGHRLRVFAPGRQ
jgi:catechol 2,3-dioxygenase-like lactoylglutathione lyase family enzyme